MTPTCRWCASREVGFLGRSSDLSLHMGVVYDRSKVALGSWAARGRPVRRLVATGLVETHWSFIAPVGRYVWVLAPRWADPLYDLAIRSCVRGAAIEARLAGWFERIAALDPVARQLVLTGSPSALRRLLESTA